MVKSGPLSAKCARGIAWAIYERFHNNEERETHTNKIFEKLKEICLDAEENGLEFDPCVREALTVILEFLGFLINDVQLDKSYLENRKFEERKYNSIKVDVDCVSHPSNSLFHYRKEELEHVIDYINDCCTTGTGGAIHLFGLPGQGKTTTLERLETYYKEFSFRDIVSVTRIKWGNTQKERETAMKTIHNSAKASDYKTAVIIADEIDEGKEINRLLQCVYQYQAVLVLAGNTNGAAWRVYGPRVHTVVFKTFEPAVLYHSAASEYLNAYDMDKIILKGSEQDKEKFINVFCGGSIGHGVTKHYDMRGTLSSGKTVLREIFEAAAWPDIEENNKIILNDGAQGFDADVLQLQVQKSFGIENACGTLRDMSHEQRESAIVELRNMLTDPKSFNLKCAGEQVHPRSKGPVLDLDANAALDYILYKKKGESPEAKFKQLPTRERYILHALHKGWELNEEDKNGTGLENLRAIHFVSGDKINENVKTLVDGDTDDLKMHHIRATKTPGKGRSQC